MQFLLCQLFVTHTPLNSRSEKVKPGVQTPSQEQHTGFLVSGGMRNDPVCEEEACQTMLERQSIRTACLHSHLESPHETLSHSI